FHDFDAGLFPVDLPFTVGQENAGWIDSIGQNVRHFEPSMPVAVYGAWGCGACRRCRLGMENYCDRRRDGPKWGHGLGRDSGLAEKLMVSDARWLDTLVDVLTEQAAPLTDEGFTAYHVERRFLRALTQDAAAVVIGVGVLGNMAVK